MNAPKRFTLLIVEDDPLMMNILHRIVLNHAPRWDVITASSEAEACRRISVDRPDSVLTDLHIGTGEGRGIAVRAAASVLGISTIVMTCDPSVSPEWRAKLRVIDKTDATEGLVRDLAMAERLSKLHDQQVMQEFVDQADAERRGRS